MARPRRPGRTRTEPGLDPIRWQRPSRGALLRLTAIAALLITAALITWSGPATCSSPAGLAAGSAKGQGSAVSSSDSSPREEKGKAADNTQAGATQAGSGQPGAGQSDAGHADTGQTDAGNADTGQAGIGQADGGQARTEKPGDGQAGDDKPGSGRAAVPAGTVGVPVRLAEPTALTLVRPGDHVDLLRVGHDSTASTAVAAAALVLSVTGADDPTTGGLLLALTPAEAAKAVTDQAGGFAVLIRP